MFNKMEKKEIYFCDNCNLNKVEHKGEWCLDCDLPERQIPFRISPNYNLDMMEPA